jgi:pyrophosphate--fructose-6-phosphate 1-phosphotransferase
MAHKNFRETVSEVISLGVPQQCSALEAARASYTPSVPRVLHDHVAKAEGTPTKCVDNEEAIRARFPNLYGRPIVDLVAGSGPPNVPSEAATPLRVGCVLSGGQAAGGHNCICGLYDYVTKQFPGSEVYGFVGGPKGVMTNSFKQLNSSIIDAHRNSGGFTMLASGRDKIESPEQFASAAATARSNDLDGLIVIGGDDSNTNAALLAEHYLKEGLKCSVVGLPKTIDGDLKNEHCEASFGFDTASKLYAELVGNIMIDCTASRKYYHFVRLMGREASHLTLEVALLTQPNLVFIGEEVRAKRATLAQITNEIADLIVQRHEAGLSYGVVIIPEGLIEFIPEVGALMKELNELHANRDDGSNCYEPLTEDSIDEYLQPDSRAVFLLLPRQIRQQLLLDRDPHGNVQVAKIESERLLGALVEEELSRRQRAEADTLSSLKLSLQYHYFGYEGRCPPPTSFDSDYCYSLGLTAGALIGLRCTGVMACLQGLTEHPSKWSARGVPLTAMMAIERRKGKDKPVIRKALVELRGAPFAALSARRAEWRMRTSYASPGPSQFEGPNAKAVTMTLQLEQGMAAEEAACPPLKRQRMQTPPELPHVLTASGGLRVAYGAIPSAKADELFVHKALPRIFNQPRIEFLSADATSSGVPLSFGSGLSIGIVFCGRQCPGAHNVVCGLSHLLTGRAGPKAELWGFVNGTRGLFKGEAKQLTPEDVSPFLNEGGMHMLGRYICAC